MLLYSPTNVIRLTFVLREDDNTRRQAVQSMRYVQVSQSVLFGENGD
jgi:hypothetical protein